VNLSRAQVLFTHLIALLGFFSIWITGVVDNLSTIVFVAALAFSFINSRIRRQYYINDNLSTFLAISLLVYVLISFFVLGVEVFKAILIFLIYTQIIKLLARKTIRDIVQIYILSFFQFLAGSVVAINFGYGVAFVVYVAVSLSAMVILNITKESHNTTSSEDPNFVTGKFLSTTALIGICVLVFTGMIFISVPRIRTGFFMSNFIRPESLSTGFSDEVRLGQVGQIKFDNSPVMRVMILNKEIDSVPRPIYWRGIALDQFDGTHWRASNRNFQTIRKKTDGETMVKRSGNELLAQEIITEPIDTDILFSANVPVGFQGLEGSMITEVNDSYILPNRTSYKLKYFAYSDLEVPKAYDLRDDNGDYPAEIIDSYLQLPILNERIQDLAKQLAKDKTNSYDMAISIKNYLQKNLKYTRTLERGTHEFPLDDFLFENKAGHCEYFATSMTVMLRILGIPSRVVNGFIDGQWNAVGDFFLIRESDAHSWVEVYFPRYGWISFDPTPGGVDPDAERGALYFFSSYLDYLKFRWSRYVIDYDQKDQNQFFSKLRSKWVWEKRKLQNKSFSELVVDKKWLMASVILTFTVWLILKKLILTSLPGLRESYAEKRATSTYKKALHVLSKKGFKKHDYMTPREFAKSVSLNDNLASSTFDAFTEEYLVLRFGKSNADEKFKNLEKLLLVLKNKIA
jgi:transglutaminase-like putative cysteine protease